MRDATNGEHESIDNYIKSISYKIVEPYISDLYPETIFKRPCSYCENEDSINICDQCCFNYDSWFRKKEKNDHADLEM